VLLFDQSTLPEVMRAFPTLASTPRVSELKPEVSKLEAALQARPSDESAQKKLRAQVEALFAAYKPAIADRLSWPNLVPKCDQIISAGDVNADIYTAVYNMITTNEARGLAEYNDALRICEKGITERRGKGASRPPLVQVSAGSRWLAPRSPTSSTYSCRRPRRARLRGRPWRLSSGSRPAT